MTATLKLRDNDGCYVCGGKNPFGLHVDFEIDKGSRSINARFIPAAHHQGYEGIIHGGILSALLDEAMVKLAFSLGISAVTAEITIKFKAPAAPGDELFISARLDSESGRLIEASARIERSGRTIAEARGKLLKV